MNSIPIYKYLSNCSVAIPFKVSKEIKNSFDELLSRTILNKRAKCNLEGYTIESLKNEFGIEKSLEMIAMLSEENINIYELGEFLREYYKNNSDIFKLGNSNTKTNFRRLVKIYDWLKYYNKKES